ncbi:MAG: hypothetical protein HY506_02025 [Candidatus Yanofskybacteria bacterium]|nr:hypothetical protein [Candidatus Yanofskybacteria bacterium]
MKESVGQEAIFLIPNGKLANICEGVLTIQDKIHGFLAERHGAFRVEATDIKGFWKGAYDGIYTKFVVAFLGKEKIPELEEFLEAIAQKINEESIYLRTGRQAWILHPDPNKSYPAI